MAMKAVFNSGCTRQFQFDAVAWKQQFVVQRSPWR
jgi:hypothetical protein